MAYRFATENLDQQDLASGFVLRSSLGFPGFPVRLASEIFQRALARHRQWSENSEPVVLWDAWCGSGYLATVLGLPHRAELATYMPPMSASERAVELAARNLALLTEAGLRERNWPIWRRRTESRRTGGPSTAPIGYSGGSDLTCRVRRMSRTCSAGRT